MQDDSADKQITRKFERVIVLLVVIAILFFLAIAALFWLSG